MAEIEAPFADGGRFADLELECAEVSQAPDPCWGEFERTGDAAQFGRSWANTTGAIFGPTIMGAIDPDRDRTGLIDDLFARFAAHAAAAPTRNDYDLAAVVVGKTG